MTDASPRQFDITWLDSGREPQVKPNPAYPDGIDVAMTTEEPCCKLALPYPAPRCGSYVVICKLCGIRVSLTTAGRPDDPRSVTIACRAVS